MLVAMLCIPAHSAVSSSCNDSVPNWELTPTSSWHAARCLLLLQTQRQLQHSLEVHQRYIHKLMEQEGLAHKIPEMSAAFNAGALPPPGSVVSEAMTAQPLAVGAPPPPPQQQQQQHHQQQQQASSAPRLLQQQHSPPQQQQPHTAGVSSCGPSSSQQQQQQQPAGINTLPDGCCNLLSDHELLLGFPELRDSGDEAGGMGLLGDHGEPPGKRQRLLTPDIAKWPSGDSADGQQ
jgi:hypothetical protein